ncbi:hypothetical protein AC624_24375 [Bacillus sp. FJAT-27238]|nr:hypothetical protein AC624_24375 [Bacillus sp. FJAT-27238]
MKAAGTLSFTKEQAEEVFNDYLRSKGYEVTGVRFVIGDTGHEANGMYKDLISVDCKVSQEL